MGPMAKAMMAVQTGQEKEERCEEHFTRALCACLVAKDAGTALDHLSYSSSIESSTCGYSEFAGHFEIETDESLRSECLALAAFLGDAALVETFYKIVSSNDEEINPPLGCRTFFGMPLWAATVQKHIVIMKYFLKSGKKHGTVRCFENNGEMESLVRPIPPPSPFVAAIELALEGNHDALCLLLDPEYKFETADWEVREGMFLASRANNVNLLSRLLARWNRASDNMEQRWRNYTLDESLIESCRGGADSTARILLDAGADPDAAGCSNRTCLQRAARSGNLTLIRMLLDEDASLVPACLRYSPYTDGYSLYSKYPNAIQEAQSHGFNHIVEVLENFKLERGYKMNGNEFMLAPRIANNPRGKIMPRRAKQTEYLRATKPRRYYIKLFPFN